MLGKNLREVGQQKTEAESHVGSGEDALRLAQILAGHLLEQIRRAFVAVLDDARGAGPNIRVGKIWSRLLKAGFFREAIVVGEQDEVA